jgi:hypothetical protein
MACDNNFLRTYKYTYKTSPGCRHHFWKSSKETNPIPKPFSSEDGFSVSRFAVRLINSWDDARKALKLPTLLEGESLAV